MTALLILLLLLILHPDTNTLTESSVFWHVWLVPFGSHNVLIEFPTKGMVSIVIVGNHKIASPGI